MESRYDADFQAALQLMQEQGGQPFMSAVVDLLNDIHAEHRPDEGGAKCASLGCECWSDPDFSKDWPCATWLSGQRVAVAWLLERAVRADSGRTPDGLRADSEGTPEGRAREQARARKARQRQREREGQGSATPQVGDSCPEGTDGGLPEGLPKGLAEASRVRSQGDSQADGNREATATASAKAPAKQMPRQVP